MEKPKLNENTIGEVEIYGHAKRGKNYYELKDYIDAEGKRYTMLEWTNLKTGDTKLFNWEKYIKEA